MNKGLLMFTSVVVLVSRFDGVNFLERYKGKKIMFVGDSISNNMWQSLTCLLHNAVPESSYALSTPTKQLSVFTIPVVFFISILIKREILSCVRLLVLTLCDCFGSYHRNLMFQLCG